MARCLAKNWYISWCQPGVFGSTSALRERTSLPSGRKANLIYGSSPTGLRAVRSSGRRRSTSSVRIGIGLVLTSAGSRQVRLKQPRCSHVTDWPANSGRSSSDGASQRIQIATRMWNRCESRFAAACAAGCSVFAGVKVGNMNQRQMTTSERFTRIFEHRAAVRINLLFKKSGGYIFSSDHSVPSSVSLNDFLQIVELAKQLGAY